MNSPQMGSNSDKNLFSTKFERVDTPITIILSTIKIQKEWEKK